MEKSWFIYFIECRNGGIYTGVTTDVVRRYEKHLSGKGARYTRMNRPVRLLGFLALENRSAALKSEILFKQKSAAAKRAWIANLSCTGSCPPRQPLTLPDEVS